MMLHINITKFETKSFFKVSLYKPIQNMTPGWAMFGPRAIIRTSLVEDY